MAFLPDLCGLQAVFLLILLGELLAVVMALADVGLHKEIWGRLGLLSFLIQWVVLGCACLLCGLRHWLGRQPVLFAGCISYGLVLLVAAICSALGNWLVYDAWRWEAWLTAMLISSIIGGVVLRYLYLQQQLSNQKAAELEARIQALQARIRPHFLFNCMNSIASLIEIDPPTAEKMVLDLSELFRTSLAEPGLIPLAEECQTCQRYIGIEQLRLGERLQVNWQQEHIEGVQIPSLLLQPIIENAIYHGIEPLPEGGVIEVSLQRQQEQVIISVQNPLPPIASFSAAGSGQHMALENIRHRLQAHYGELGGLELIPKGRVIPRVY